MNYQNQIKKAYRLNYSFFSNNSSKFINSYLESRKKIILEVKELIKKKYIN